MVRFYYLLFLSGILLAFPDIQAKAKSADTSLLNSSQLIAMDIGKYSPIAIVVGVMLGLFAHNKKLSQTAKALIYFGILFFGLYTMERSVEPLRDSGTFANLMVEMNNPLKGTGAGALVTLIIQSSSATVGIVITLAKKGLIELPGALAVMLGAGLGTCADTLLATIRSNRQAIKTGLFHLGFNIVSIVLGLIFFGPFVALVAKLAAGTSLAQHVATGHVLFNVAGVVLFLPFVKPIARLLDWMVPDKPRVSMRSPVAG